MLGVVLSFVRAEWPILEGSGFGVSDIVLIWVWVDEREEYWAKTGLSSGMR